MENKKCVGRTGASPLRRLSLGGRAGAGLAFPGGLTSNNPACPEPRPPRGKQIPGSQGRRRGLRARLSGDKRSPAARGERCPAGGTSAGLGAEAAPYTENLPGDTVHFCLAQRPRSQPLRVTAGGPASRSADSIKERQFSTLFTFFTLRFYSSVFFLSFFFFLPPPPFFLFRHELDRLCRSGTDTVCVAIRCLRARRNGVMAIPQRSDLLPAATARPPWFSRAVPRFGVAARRDGSGTSQSQPARKYALFFNDSSRTWPIPLCRRRMSWALTRRTPVWTVRSRVKAQ